jgi:hypothetical protein
MNVARICDRLHTNDTYSSRQFFYEASKMNSWEAVLKFCIPMPGAFGTKLNDT